MTDNRSIAKIPTALSFDAREGTVGKPVLVGDKNEPITACLASRDVLGGDVIGLRDMGNKDRALQSRGRLLTDWFDARYREGLDPYVKFSDSPIGPSTLAFDRKGKQIANADGHSVNFASQDYLSLSAHPAIKQAAVDAIARYGVHSAGS